jgi:hypothetical protein
VNVTISTGGKVAGRRGGHSRIRRARRRFEGLLSLIRLGCDVDAICIIKREWN